MDWTRRRETILPPHIRPMELLGSICTAREGVAVSCREATPTGHSHRVIDSIWVQVPHAAMWARKECTTAAGFDSSPAVWSRWRRIP